jgi:hypothetical protein
MYFMVTASDGKDTRCHLFGADRLPLTLATAHALAEHLQRDFSDVMIVECRTVARWGPNGMPKETA